jgi:hypothetical protein
MAGGYVSSEDWQRQLLIQQFVIKEGAVTRLEASEVEVLLRWGLIETVDTLTGPELMFAEGLNLDEARKALRVRQAFAQRSE